MTDEHAEHHLSDETLIQTLEAQRQALMDGDEFDFLSQIEIVALLWWQCADFHLYVTHPVLERFSPPKIILPEKLADSNQLEYVYSITDYGDQLSTSKGEDFYAAGFSMCKLYFTIEKMIAVLVQRIKDEGIGEEAEVQVAFGGHEFAQRKAFESIINLKYNVVVTNFDPGPWGEKYLQNVKRISEQGYGYPTETPRDTYRHPTSINSTMIGG
ncbi:MAG: virulence factor [Legionellaceae bacterium]|nr:virulence factor [Legionellaceae bacterium]